MFLLRAAGNMRYPQERMVLDQGGHQCPHRVRLVLALNRPLAWPILATILLHRRSCSRRGSGDLPPTHANLHPPAHVAEHSDGIVPLPLLRECVDEGGVDAAAGLHPALGHVGKQVLHLREGGAAREEGGRGCGGRASHEGGDSVGREGGVRAKELGGHIHPADGAPPAPKPHQRVCRSV